MSETTPRLLRALADGGEWKISLNNDYIPRLRISSTYRDLIAKGTLAKTERDYLRERIRSGKFLIDSIEQKLAGSNAFAEIVALSLGEGKSV
eukprot:gene55084-biopygen39248